MVLHPTVLASDSNTAYDIESYSYKEGKSLKYD